jgi:hypothetical protein
MKTSYRAALVLYFVTTIFTSCSHFIKKQDLPSSAHARSKIAGPISEVGVARLLKEDSKTYYVEVFFPPEFVETPPAEVWIPSLGGKKEKTVPFGRYFEFFDAQGLIWKSFLVSYATQRIWCENDAETSVGTFVKMAVPKKALTRVTPASKRTDQILSFVHARPVGGPDKAAGAVDPGLATHQVKLKSVASDAGCGDDLSEQGLELDTAFGAANLRCCGP